MSIIRAPRPEGNFYLLNKAISEDARLSWAARGLLVFLLGKPDHWEVSTHHLIGQTKDCLGKASGRDAVRGLIRELEQAGYLRIIIERADGGEFGGRSYTVSESPETDYPSPVEPSPVNPPLVSIDVKQGLKKAARTEKPLCGNELAEAFEVFWKLYPNKVAKQKARKAWDKIKPDAELRQRLITALGNHRVSRDWSKDDGQYIPMASTWLNGERWNDILKPVSTAGKPYTNLPTHTPDMYQGDDNAPAF